MVVNAIEPRAAIGSYDKAKERYTLHSCSQGVMGLKAGITAAMKTTPDKVHVITGNVGGSFGMKAQVYPEYVCILHAAKTLGRPVKWTDERSSSFVSDNHGRDHEQTAELALDAEGHFLALRLNGYGNLGGFQGAMSPQPPTLNTVRNVISLYRTPLIEVNTKCVFTNTTLRQPLSRRRPPRGQLLHGAADRLRRRRDAASTASSFAARTRSARARSRASPPPAPPMTAATSRRS